MDAFPCDECRAIHRELQEAFATVKERLSGPGTTPVDLVAWLQGLDEDECAQVRETSPLWRTWHRWQQHRALTGHYLSPLPVPPSTMGNPN